MIRVLFVCLGNICRSPTAEGVFTHIAAQAGLASKLQIDSCGTGAWHVGSAPDARSIDAAKKRGVDISVLRARQLHADDFIHFDYMIAMDRSNLADIKARCPSASKARICLFLDYATRSEVDEVPDPYYGGEDGFEQVLDLVEQASHGLLAEITDRYAN